MLTLNLFDTPSDKLFSSLEKAKKIISSPSIYGDNLAVKLMQIDNLPAGKFYEPDTMSEHEKTAFQEHLLEITRGTPRIIG